MRSIRELAKLTEKAHQEAGEVKDRPTNTKISASQCRRLPLLASYYRPKTKLWEGNFSQACVILSTWGCLGGVSQTPPWQTPWTDIPPPHTPTTPHPLTRPPSKMATEADGTHPTVMHPL